MPNRLPLVRRHALRPVAFGAALLAVSGGVAPSARAQMPTPAPAATPAPMPTPAATPAPAAARRARGPRPAPVGYTGKEAPDEAGVLWMPAAPGNFTAADRPHSTPINMVVIHDIEGSAIGAVQWFQNPKSQVSAHYVVDGTTGQIWQQVLEKDIAWHAGNWDVNTRAVGIEHEGFAYRPGYYDVTLYEASARLVRDITTRWNIPRDRQHIIGHFEVPNPKDPTKSGGGSGHTDPGPYWDWDYYMTLVRSDARLDTPNPVPAPLVLHPGEKREVLVSFTNQGDDPWPANLTGRHDPDLEARGPVYMGTASANPSPFFGPDTWVSPRLVTGARDGDTAPNAAATFSLVLTGPRTFGPVSEAFRLVKMPVAPHVPVPFGPTVSVAATVQPWEIIWDANTPGFTAPPGWERREAKGQPTYSVKAPDAKNPTPLTPAAGWQAALPISGDWDVYARWPSGKGNTEKAVYEITTPDGVKTITLDQRSRAGQWVLLGRFSFADPKTVRVSLRGPDDKKTAVLDAVRFVGPFPKESPAPVKPKE